MIPSKVHQCGYRGAASVCGIRLIKLKNIARMTSAVAMISAGIPLYGHGLQNGSEYSSQPSVQHPAGKNAPPSARTDFVDVGSAATSFNVLANDFDIDGDRLIVIEANAEFGAVAFTPEGLLAYAQEAGTQRSDKIRYTVSDGRGGVDTGLVEVSARQQ